MQSPLTDLTAEQLRPLEQTLAERYREVLGQRLSLDMTRGKPSSEQLDLSDGLLRTLDSYQDKSGTDCRNYGGLEGLPEMRAMFGEFFQCSQDNVLVGTNSSLHLMYSAMTQAAFFGVPGGAKPWREQGSVRFLCPSPGYDRHFSLTSEFGIDMVPVEMGPEGPDMDAVEELAKDPAVKGIWCVPVYSNPTGVTFSESTAARLAAMQAAPDFRIMWDNAYCEHHLMEDVSQQDRGPDILSLCKAAGNENRVLMFASMSKITYAGSAVAATAMSPENLKAAKAHLKLATLGPNKLNQLAHLRFFGDIGGLRAHMMRHAAIVRPRFAAVQEGLAKTLGGKGVATWANPRGGYFVSLDVLDGCAKETVRLAAEAGVKLTPAGATFPYGRDPRDRNVRIAPTFPTLEEIQQATLVVGLCVELAAVRKLLER